MEETTREIGVLRALRWVGGLFMRLPRPAGIVLFLVWTRVIWHLSSMSAKSEGGNFLRGWLMNSGHAPLFGFLAFLALVSLPRTARLPDDGAASGQRRWPQMSARGCALILFAVLAYGLLDEWHQSQVPTRDASLWDVITDMTGAACTLWIASYLGKNDAHARGLGWRLIAGLSLCLLAGLKAAT